MPRKKIVEPEPVPVVPPILRTAVYGLKEAQLTLGIAPNCRAREIRLKRLRSAKRSGKVLILGRWLLDWIEAGAIERETAKAVEPMATE